MSNTLAPEMELKKTTNSSFTSELASYHQHLVENFKAGKLKAPTADATALMAFNGYYTLNTAPGAFFAVDANVVVTGSTSVNTVDLLVSLDGKKATRYPFTGTFNGTQLSQSNADISINLTFTRSTTSGPTASLAGTISVPGTSTAIAKVTGSTYNNPIAMSVYIGNYYDEATGTKVMEIGQKNILLYASPNSTILQPVADYAYNLNMYYFSFTQGTQKVALIMGTATAKGFACNNMIVDSKGNTTTSRSLLTILNPTIIATKNLPNINSSALAAFSGYYQLTTGGKGNAFLSVQAQYVTLVGQLDMYVVMLGISIDGVTSTGYTFDSTMSFDGTTLTVPASANPGDPNLPLSITFTRNYTAANYGLVSIAGTIGKTTVGGYTPLNPVPLSVFGGAPMVGLKGGSAEGISLTVVNDNEVIYKGTKFTTPMASILYVPLMYILAYPATNPTVVMSFGTDGLRGNACIITDNNNIYTVYAIPSTND
jgi:hypothetical protein